jgi:ATP:ADP antiporter, AAA family
MPISLIRGLDRVTAKKVGLLFLFFFLVIAAFWTLKPLRTSSVVRAFGSDYYPLFKQGFVFFVPLFMGLFTSMTCYLNREQMVYFFVGLFLTASWVFWGLFEFALSPLVQIAFYFYVDAYITLMVVLFFSYMSEVFETAEAKQYYGLIGIGGLVGGIAGSAISGWASELLGNHIILMITLFLVPICWIVHTLKPLVPAADRETICPPQGKTVVQRFTEGMTLVFQSKYLVAIVLIVGLYEIMSTTIDYQFVALTEAAFPDRAQMASFQGKVSFWSSIAALLVQMFLTTYILRSKGVLGALILLPALLLVGSSVLLVFPILAVITLTTGGDAAFAYSINQVSKEVLYVPLDSVARFKSKAFIDMFVQRGAKAMGGLLVMAYTLYLSKRGFSPKLLMAGNVICGVVWIGAVLYVSRAFNQYTQAQQAEVDLRKAS